ncbi:MAG: Gfo/Idh/MocA family oxidoreductase, partial [Coriobacteriaceae bacterium]|nr:Gfo/Idh/MocA family oxidoreductase [Coriobacteriaceae bacterium]
MLNVCVIGSGRAGRIHAKSYAGGVIGARLLAVCDPSDEARAAAKADFGAERSYADWRDVMDDSDIDAVVIVTPTGMHRDVAVAAAAAGKHVFCEKPMASSEAECDEIIAACDAAGVKLQIGFMRRFEESAQHAKEAIEAGEIGDVVLVKSLTHGPSHPKEWMYDVRKSFGPIGEVSSHDFDLLRWFAGSEVESVYAIGGNFRSPEVAEQYPEWYDSFAMTLTFADGKLGMVEGAQYVQYGYDFRFEVLGTKGSILVGQQPRETYSIARADGRIVRPMNNSWTYLFREAYIREAQAFVDAIVHDTPTRVTGHDGKMAVRLVNMGLESLLTHSVVHDERLGA